MKKRTIIYIILILLVSTAGSLAILMALKPGDTSPPSSEDSPLSTSNRIKMHVDQARQFLDVGKTSQAIEEFTNAKNIYQETGDQEGAASMDQEINAAKTIPEQPIEAPTESPVLEPYQQP